MHHINLKLALLEYNYTLNTIDQAILLYLQRLFYNFTYPYKKGCLHIG